MFSGHLFSVRKANLIREASFIFHYFLSVFLILSHFSDFLKFVFGKFLVSLQKRRCLKIDSDVAQYGSWDSSTKILSSAIIYIVIITDPNELHLHFHKLDLNRRPHAVSL